MASAGTIDWLNATVLACSKCQIFCPNKYAVCANGSVSPRCEPCGEPDREGWEDDMEADDEGELDARQQNGIQLHDQAPHWLARLPAPPPDALVALETEDRDLRSPDFGRKSRGYVAGHNRDVLCAVHGVSDHAATDRAADLLAPQLLAGHRVKRIEIAAHVAKEHKAPRGRRHATQDRI